MGGAKVEGRIYGVKASRQSMRSGNNIEYSKNWWAGSFKDILFNTAGFYTGKILNKNFGWNLCIKNINEEASHCKARKKIKKGICRKCGCDIS
jgi:hypothetical protein